MIIPVITGATGIVTRAFKNVRNHTNYTFSRFTTKTATLGTSRITRKVLQSA